MTVLRVFAVLVASAAVIDPAVPLPRTSPPPVQLHLDPTDADAVADAPRVRAALRDRVTFVDGDDAAAHVMVGRVRPAAAAFARPLSQVTLDDPPEVVIDEAPAAVQVTVNGSTTIPVVLHGRGVAGRTSVVAVEDDGLELTRL